MRKKCLACAELLDVYRAAILRMQQQLRRMPSVSVASLNFSLQEFKARTLPCPTIHHSHLSLPRRLGSDGQLRAHHTLGGGT